ncbi:carboxypeptidase-like regulatory domain-containing protein, partial [Haloferax profundi]|uniref:carboxypeptidase-like regulatory domain-containing protein n=1 Tax=Haloferax profundi TaxID=1544718 RepID=UPI000B2FD028
THTVVLKEKVPITGTVTDSEGNPASNVEVVYHSESAYEQARTNASGVYSMQVPPNETYHIDLRQSDLSGDNFPNDG